MFNTWMDRLYAISMHGQGKITEKDAMKMADELLHIEKALAAHRAKKIMCEETCFCWDVDRILSVNEIVAAVRE